MRFLLASVVLLHFVVLLSSFTASAEPANMPCDCWDGTIVTTSPQCTCSCTASADNTVEPYCAFKSSTTTQLDIVMNYTNRANFSAGVTEIEFSRQIEAQYVINGAFPELGNIGTSTTSTGSRWNGTFSFVIFEETTSNALARAYYPTYPVVARFLMDGDVAQMVLEGVNRRDPGWTTNLSVITAYPFLQDPAPAENLRGFIVASGNPALRIYDIIWVIFIVVIFCCCCCECCCFYSNTQKKAEEKANLLGPKIIPALGVVEQPQVFQQQPPGVIMPVSVIAPAGGTFSPTNGAEQDPQQQKEQPELIVHHSENNEHHVVDEQQESSPPGMVV